MGVQERRAREKQELRQDILDAARELFVKEGFENVSMRKIAEKIEYSPTTIYLYFQDKADLLDCICEETFSKLDQKMTSLRDATADPLQGLKRGLRAYVEFGLEHPNHYRLCFMMDFKGFEAPENCSRSHAMGQKLFDHLRLGLGECVALGRVKVDNIEAVSQAIWASFHGVTSLLITHHTFPWVETNQLIDALTETVFGGLEVGTPISAVDSASST